MSMAYQPKSYRKFLAGTVSAAVVASAIAPVASASFTDVAGSVHANDIATLVAKGYIKGYADGTFKPDKPLTRGEAAIIFSRILKDAGVKAPEQGAGFPDVPASKAELAEAVAIVKAAGVMGGDEKGNFNPNANITREQMAKVVVEAFKLTKPENHTTKITDLDKAGSWAREYIQTLEANGVTKNTEFAPKQNVTRGQFASFVVRAMDVKKEVSAADITAVKLVDEKTLEVTFNGELKEVKKEDFAIQGVEIESVSIKAAAAAEAKTTVVVIKTKTALQEGKSYSVSYKGQTTDKAKVDVPVVTPKVESVSAINAKTLQIKFNKAIDASTVLDDKSTTDTSDDTLKTTSIKLTELDGQTAVTQANIKASLSEDKKTLTLVASGNQFFTKRYVVDIKNVKTTDGKDVPAYTTTIDATDSVRPTVLSTSYEDNGLTLKVKFSEPLASVGTVKLYDGTTEIAVSPSLNSNGDEMTISLASSSVPVNKDLTLKIFGAVDYNGNVINANPSELTVKKTTVDTTKPTVQSVEAVNDKTVKVTFSEKLSGNPTIKIGGTTATVSVDSTGLVYTATLASAKTGIQAVEVSSYSDLSGNAGDVYTKVVELKADTTAPKLVSSQVVKVNGVEKLVLTFDEEVDPQTGVTFISSTDKYIDDNNTQKAVGSTLATSASNFTLYNAVNGKSKSVALDISSLPKGTYTVSLPNGLVKDLASTPNAYAEGKQITFVRDTDSLTTKPALDVTVDTNGVEVVDNNTLRFTFTQNLDASALNLSNFNINGLALSKAVFDGDTMHILVTIAPGANTWTGIHTITVSNIKNVSGLVMDTVTTTESMKENVAPTFAATLVGPDVIKVDFSEAVANSTIGTALSGSNFTVKVDGTANTVTGVYTNSDASSAVANNTGYKTVYLKLQNQVSDLTKPITVSATGIVDVAQTGAITATDVVGNTVSNATVNVSK